MRCSEAFREGRDYIRAYGWRQKYLGGFGQPACLAGSLPRHSQAFDDLLQNRRPNGEMNMPSVYLSAAIGELYGERCTYIPSWNDEASTTEEKVVEVLEYAEKLAARDGN
jgi:hypothetical protein